MTSGRVWHIFWQLETWTGAQRIQGERGGAAALTFVF